MLVGAKIPITNRHGCFYYVTSNMRSQRARPFYLDITLALVTVVLGFGLGFLTFSKQFNAEEKFRLNQNLNKLLDIKLQYPFLEDSVFRSWWSKNKNSNNDSSLRYQTYCIYVLNFAEDVCDYYKYDSDKINKFIDIEDLIEPTREYWEANVVENYKSYGPEFKEFIDQRIK
jgi:hypothetical protein